MVTIFLLQTQQYRESMRPLIKPASQTDQLGNASNSSSVGRTMSMTSKFFEVFGKKQKGRREPTQNSHNINEATTTPHSPPPHSPPPSFLYNPLSQVSEPESSLSPSYHRLFYTIWTKTASPATIALVNKLSAHE